MERLLRNLRLLWELHTLLNLVLFFGPIIAVIVVFEDWLDPIVFAAFEPGTFPFAVFRLVGGTAGCGFVLACWVWIGGWLDGIRQRLRSQIWELEREP
jgi:hypothetical protein